MGEKQKEVRQKYFGVPLKKVLPSDVDGTILVRGYFTSDQKDEVGDIITRSATERAIVKYRRWGNVRYMHMPKPVGKISRIGADDGLDWNEVEIKVIDPQAVFDVENDLLTALSVGIYIDFEDVEILEDGGWLINDYGLSEISLVDHPANYDAMLTGVVHGMTRTLGQEIVVQKLDHLKEGLTLKKQEALVDEALEEEIGETDVEEVIAEKDVEVEEPQEELEKEIEVEELEEDTEIVKDAPAVEEEPEVLEIEVPGISTETKEIPEDDGTTVAVEIEVIEELETSENVELVELKQQVDELSKTLETLAEAFLGQEEQTIGEDVTAELDQLRQKNLELEEENKALLEELDALRLPAKRKGLVPETVLPEELEDLVEESDEELVEKPTLRGAVAKFLETRHS